MAWLLLVLLALLLLLILVLITKLTIRLNYQHLNDNDDLKVEFRIWFGIIRYKIHVPSVKIADDSPSIVTKSKTYAVDSEEEETEMKEKEYTKGDFLKSRQRRKELLRKVFNFHAIVKSFLRHVYLKKWQWDTMIGLGDAAHTAVSSGALWSIKGWIIGFVSSYVTLKEAPKISITPEFQRTIIQTRLQCIIQFRIGHAILAGLKMIKNWRGTKPHLENKPEFSNEKINSV